MLRCAALVAWREQVVQQTLEWILEADPSQVSFIPSLRCSPFKSTITLERRDGDLEKVLLRLKQSLWDIRIQNTDPEKLVADIRKQHGGALRRYALYGENSPSLQRNASPEVGRYASNTELQDALQFITTARPQVRYMGNHSAERLIQALDTLVGQSNAACLPH